MRPEQQQTAYSMRLSFHALLHVMKQSRRDRTQRIRLFSRFASAYLLRDITVFLIEPNVGLSSGRSFQQDCASFTSSGNELLSLNDGLLPLCFSRFMSAKVSIIEMKGQFNKRTYGPYRLSLAYQRCSADD